MERVLILGASGQIGTELVNTLRAAHGNDQVIAADLRAAGLSEPCACMDATDEQALRELVTKLISQPART